MHYTGDGITIGGIHQEVQPILFPPSISSTTLSCSRAAYPKCLHCNNRRQNSKLSKLTYPARETLWRDSVCYFKTPVHTAETSRMHCHVYTECCRGQRGRPVAVKNCRLLCRPSVIVNRQHAWPSEPGSTVAVIYLAADRQKYEPVFDGHD